MYTLPETELMKIETLGEDDRAGKYLIEPLSPGYGVTIGNSLRRILFASLEGSAITAVRIDGATHEFTTIPGMKEDVVELILNLKTLRVKLIGDEPTTIRLSVKGSGIITGAQFDANPNVQIVDQDHHIATLDKQGKLIIEALVERGRGYVPTEQKRNDQQPLGTISVDSIFTPVKKVHYDVVNTRVGGMTNFDRLSIDITTDGTIHPRMALAQAAKILVEHLTIISEITLPEEKPAKKLSKKAIALAAAEAELSDEAVAPTDEIVLEKPIKVKKTAIETEAEPILTKPSKKKTKTTSETE